MAHKTTTLIGVLGLSLALEWGPVRLRAATPVPANPADVVAAVPVEGLIRKPANLFNLQGKTVRFTPAAGGGYTVEVIGSADLAPAGATLSDGSAQYGGPAKSRRVALPFDFPFAGKSWRALYINNDGNLSFDKPESDLYPQRDPWPSGGMRSVAAALDSRAAAGLEQMIAVHWSVYSTDPGLSSVRTQASADRLVVTWSVQRTEWNGDPLGVNLFQARLYPSGVIEMAYASIADPDGIVGLFTGQATGDRLLDHVEYAGQAPDPSVDIASADIYDAGTVLKFVYTMKRDALTTVPSGLLTYRFSINSFGSDDLLETDVTPTGEPQAWSALGRAPRSAGVRIDGHTVTMYLSKVLLAGSSRFEYSGDVVWWGMPGRFAQIAWGNQRRSVDLSSVAPGEVDLTRMTGPRRGSLFEVFHYPAVTKNTQLILKTVCRQYPPRDDFAFVCTYRVNKSGRGR